MISKEHFFASCRDEVRIVKHLATCIPEGAYDWRPTPAQRSTLELMQYMAVMTANAARFLRTNNWDHAPEYAKRSESITPENFAEAMDAQMAEVEETLAELGPDDADNAASKPWGEPTTLAEAMLQVLLKPLVAYRMQLFLYAKQSGNADIGTFDTWAGRPAPQPTA